MKNENVYFVKEGKNIGNFNGTTGNARSEGYKKR